MVNILAPILNISEKILNISKKETKKIGAIAIKSSSIINFIIFIPSFFTIIPLF